MSCSILKAFEPLILDTASGLFLAISSYIPEIADCILLALRGCPRGWKEIEIVDGSFWTGEVK